MNGQSSLTSVLRQVARRVPGARHTYRALRDRRADWDIRRLQARFPGLTLRDYEWLRDPYERYVRDFSSDVMAVSYETARLLASICDYLKPSTVLDLGSGFSSFVLRRLAQNVTSVDSDKAWLAVTERFLREESLSTDRLMHLDDFDWTARYELVFFDIGPMTVRKRLLPDALRATSPGGLLVLDDLHKPDYRRVVRRVIPRHRYSLRAWTLDSFGRFAEAVSPP